MAAVGRCGRPLQLTLALLKPDAVAHPLVLEAVHETILSNRFLIVRAKKLRCGREESRRFYREHAGRFFYQRLVEFMASGPMWAYILAHENAVLLWRSLMGPTKVFRARNSVPDSIRGAYGLTDTRNTTHGSDSPASASREIAFFFPEFNEQLWYQQEEPRLRCGQVYYNAEERTDQKDLRNISAFLHCYFYFHQQYPMVDLLMIEYVFIQVLCENMEARFCLSGICWKEEEQIKGKSG